MKLLLAVLLGLIVIYAAGPAPAKAVYSPVLPKVPETDQLEAYIASNEKAHKLRPNNEARIVWANDSVHQPTDVAIVYLHGFSASQEEGNPVHRNIARYFGCNLYLARLAEHGIDTTEQLLNLTPENYWESAKEALAIGLKLGKKVILMGTSTGGTQALQLAAQFPDQVQALILYSPNIAINDDKAFLLNNPWGLTIARTVKKSHYITPDDQRPVYKQYWNSPYRLEAAVALQEMLETTMNESTFRKIHQPLLLLYYFKDEAHQDPIVKVSAMKEMFESITTPAAMKQAVPIPNAGNHVLASPIKSGAVQEVELATRQFMEQVLKLPHHQ